MKNLIFFYYNELIKDYLIIDGNFNRTINERLDKCDTVIYLDFSRVRCLFGVTKRVLKNYGQTRSDMGENCPEKFDIEFFKWIWNFNKIYRDKYYKLLSSVEGKKIVIVHNHMECRRVLEKV